MSEETPKEEKPEAAVPPHAAPGAGGHPWIPRGSRVIKPVPFFASPEFRRIVLLILVALGGLAVVLQVRWNKARYAEDLRKDEEDWKRRQEALKAAPQPGQVTEGGVVLWDNMLAQEKDDEPLEGVVADRGYKRLIQHLANWKPGESLGQVEAFDYLDLLKNPAHHRGKTVSLYGLVNKVYSNIRLESNQGSFDCVYRLYLVDLSGTQACIVDVLERPDGIDERTPVQCDGIFIRTHKYETVKGQTARVPFFVARAVRKLDRGPRPTLWTKETAIVVVGICVMLVAVIFLTGRASRPKPKTDEVSSK